ncbi:hypothetical protein [Stenoxybacter acetivorans]|uniref:hypothetical protein n=1 Tax=Stenoxybacter acetivorans TaxID=422441 RepID=UPI0005670C35|nr:hypothetical protein [Stenoxybacter acetivorans]
MFKLWLLVTAFLFFGLPMLEFFGVIEQGNYGFAVLGYIAFTVICILLAPKGYPVVIVDDRRKNRD